MKKRGFTLIEFMVACVVFALFMYTLYTLFSGGLRAYKKGEVITLLKKNASELMDYVTTDFRMADSVSEGTTTLTITRTIFGKNTSGLEGIDGHTILYTYTSGQVSRDDTISTANGYTEEVDMVFGAGKDNIYFYSQSGVDFFTYDSTTETLKVAFYDQYGTQTLASGEGWKQLKIATTLGTRNQGSAYNTVTNSKFTGVVKDATNDAIEDPGTAPSLVRFIR
ncbi:MAG: prepilin-type N-terminal cleavage/methylation domain-containing protein [Candidatus Eremiobacteraeota bacterium]|nr:prepilin-type N-terminal cleavage/methylation domain-containing protein [Candidatus Eremiobacteraeota bacterium]